ncbi:MAG: hypothetical protein ACLPVO_07595 [Desulfomonilaceae bacterium]
MKNVSLLVVVVSFLFFMISMPGYAENKEEGIIQNRNAFKR